MKKVLSISVLTLLVTIVGCKEIKPQKSESGISKATVKIETASNGLTIEQTNISKRLSEDNKIGSIKHLYIISAMSGQTIIYSTVDGKVTSGGKRLTNTHEKIRGFEGHVVLPKIQDDGTYGSSMNYLYWWDIKGVYHQHYVTGGQIVHISGEALPVSDITINLSN